MMYNRPVQPRCDGDIVLAARRAEKVMRHMRRVLTLGMAAVMLAGIWSGGSFASAAGPAEAPPAEDGRQKPAPQPGAGPAPPYTPPHNKNALHPAPPPKRPGGAGQHLALPPPPQA